MVGLDPTVYEFINLAISLLAFFLMGVFGRYFLIELWRRRGRWMRSYWSEAHRASIGLTCLCAGEGGLRMWTWIARHGDRVGWWTKWMGDEPYSFVPIIFAGLQIAGLLCAARALVPNVWAWEMTSVLFVVAILVTFLT